MPSKNREKKLIPKSLKINWDKSQVDERKDFL